MSASDKRINNYLTSSPLMPQCLAVEPSKNSKSIKQNTTPEEEEVEMQEQKQEENQENVNDDEVQEDTKEKEEDVVDSRTDRILKSTMDMLHDVEHLIPEQLRKSKPLKINRKKKRPKI